MTYRDLLIAAIDRARLIGPLVNAGMARNILRSRALLPFHIHERLSHHRSQLQKKAVQSLLARREDMKHSGCQLLAGVYLAQSLPCLFPLSRVYFHRGSLSLMRYRPVDYPTVGATLQFQLRMV